MADAGHQVHLIVGDGIGDAVVEGIAVHDIGPRPGSRPWRMWHQPRLAAEAIAAIAPDVVHLHDPELLPLGVRLARAGMRVVYDAHEDVSSQIRRKEWVPLPLRGLIANGFEAYERRAVRRLAGVVAATPHIARRFSRMGVPTTCINNYPLPGELAPPVTEIRRLQRVCYVGVIAKVRGIREVVRALALVPEARLTLCGAMSEDGLEAALRAEPGWGQVDYLGEVDRITARRVMAESSAGVVTYLPAPNHFDAQPTKLFEYMSAALPVIVSSFPLWRQIVEEAGAGLCVDPTSPTAIADAIRTLLTGSDEAARMGRAGSAAVQHHYNWPAEAVKLVSFYDGFA